MTERFFPEAAQAAVYPHSPTIQRVSVITESGNTLIECIDVDTIDDPLRCMKYTDFSIQKCIENGVDLKHLNIVHDAKIGIDDADIEDFDSRVESISNELFNQENK